MRQTTLTLAALLFSSAAFASNSSCDSNDPTTRLACFDQLADTIDACQAKTDKLDRLVCYDDLYRAIKTAFGGKALAQPSVMPTPAPTVAAPAQASPTAVPAPSPVTPTVAQMQDGFGNERKRSQTESKQLESISSAVTKVVKDPYKKWTLTLANGQRWKQTESRHLRVNVGDTVVIKRASFGSFLLHRAGSNKQMRVKRL
ncbi:hypothetical protein [uncultured Ferrimonas sp.]|uniref:hypothetical protein n=1 Tax=uncultured Ferrimonas sp. TaxID=432640 RepID=UPI00260CA060|nr:hypothetical protein [uncultured Ferrimonas sp.]